MTPGHPDKETMDDKIERIERKLDLLWGVLVVVVFTVGGFYVKTALETVIGSEIITNVFIFIWIISFVWLNSEFSYKKSN